MSQLRQAPTTDVKTKNEHSRPDWTVGLTYRSVKKASQ